MQKHVLMAVVGFLLSGGMAVSGDPEIVDLSSAVTNEPLFTVTFDGTLKSVDLCGQTECVIPPFVKSIGLGAFRACTNLVSVTIPSTVTNIEYRGFDPLSPPPPIVLSEEGNGMVSPFSKCVNLANVTVSQYVCDKGLVDIFAEACSSITNVVFDQSVTNIGTWTITKYYSVGGLKRSVSCGNVTSLTFTRDVTMTRSVPRAPYEMEPLWGPNGVFAGNSTLKSVTFGEGVTQIDNYAFEVCYNLSNVTFADSVKSIGFAAFLGCTNLVAVMIPASVTNVEDYAFAGCTRLSAVLFEGNAPVASASVFGGEPEAGSFADLFTPSYVNDFSVAEDCCAYVLKISTGWGVDIPGSWNGIRIAYLQLITPAVLYDLDVSAVQTVAKSFSDPAVARNVTNDIETYQAYRDWATAVGVDEVSTSSTAWMSYALGSSTLLDEPKEGDLQIDEVSPAADGESVAMVFSLAGVDIADTDAVSARLGTVFEVQGADDVNALEPVTPTLEAHEGKVKATLSVPAGAKSYFLKVKMK